MLLFLDFDGVLHPYPCSDSEYFCWMDNLESILQFFPNTEVVISSSWREHYSFAALKQLFPKTIQKQIIDVTPVVAESSYAEGGREIEIIQWLKQQGREQGNWIAVDDNINLFDQFMQNVIECDSMTGLDDDCAQQLWSILNSTSQLGKSNARYI